MDLSPWMEQLRDPNTGTLQINFLKKEFTYFIYLFIYLTVGYLAQNCTQAELGKGQDNLQDGTRALQKVAASHGCIPRAFVPDFPDTPGPQTTQEETLWTTPNLQGCHSGAFTAA